MRSLPSPMEVLLSDLLLFPPAAAANDADPVGQAATSSSSAFGWPRLGGLQLSAERLDARNRGIGGSDANIILSGRRRAGPAPVAGEARRGRARGPQRQAVGGARLLDRGVQPPVVREAQRQPR